MLKAVHVYEHDAVEFQELVNQALGAIAGKGGVIHEVQYAIDPSTPENRKGGFGALVIAEIDDEPHVPATDDEE